ncbi:helix-turn-helix domain-containing protein [Rouxiella badensis]|jgi:transcriptional regulator with XRE-family HTH domain|uniref:Transcriptional regulator n=2 Tax=Rouxiella badensis TaxID=1646377 RepID=A0A1X0WAS9_9GAMM|nr:helix-turn-helix domain-containing protein [Rouxiella badensis]MCC3704243.1 helix-turn-helix domain-containing protein [Rouxiella badensis]MCC3719694.1 helix-turn-helix domain-containing protein [Rouxiella badensis]MCC3728944.1 helix-turn-helix domain-containing protein [Rouxiella badensis]MCC3733371.1 helix-turn-helix domain-containing protein [Rouxiella badensis]MCC3740860.1 helix-turn-helix domain-containing protein [Rouxiella badensis]
MMTPGDRIKLRRKEMKYTQRKLASVVKVSHVTISQWESCDTTPGGRNLFALASALKCTPTWILYGDTETSPIPIESIAPPLAERELELLRLFAYLPESEKERHMAELQSKVDEFNKLFAELLHARNELNI